MTPEQLELAEQQHRDDVAAAGRAADDAYDAFVAEARRFDSAFDTWEAAFDAAADAIGEATDGGVSDGGWDHFDSFVDGALVVLQVAGIILAIAAFVIGGPLIALLGALVALAALALALYKAGRGNAKPWEVGARHRSRSARAPLAEPAIVAADRRRLPCDDSQRARRRTSRPGSLPTRVSVAADQGEGFRAGNFRVIRWGRFRGCPRVSQREGG